MDNSSGDVAFVVWTKSSQMIFGKIVITKMDFVELAKPVSISKHINGRLIIQKNGLTVVVRHLTALISILFGKSREACARLAVNQCCQEVRVRCL